MTSVTDKAPPLWDHQRLELEDHWEDAGRALLWSMRTGKSRVVIERADKLWTRGLVQCVVVLAPNGVHDNWVLREIPKYTGLAKTLAWSQPERDLPDFVRQFDVMCDERADVCYLYWLTVNSEALQFRECRQAIGRFIRKRKFLLVCDESDDYGAPGSKRTHAARAIARKADYRMILSGTVVEDSPLKAFSQYEILAPAALGHRTAEEFTKRYAEYERVAIRGGFRKGRTYPKLKGYRNIPELRDRMARWSSVVLREDCHDMPELLNVQRSYRPSTQQLHAYEELRRELSVTVDYDVTVTALEAAVRLAKFQQILGGYIIDNEGQVRDIPGPNPRLDCLSTEVMFDPGQVIVACRFREDVRRVVERLRADGHEVVEYKGGMKSSEKNRSLDLFQAGRAKAIVLTPIRGLELSAADTIIWYSHTFWAMMRRQTDERGTKMGGTATTVVDISAKGIRDGVDGYILDNQSGKRSMADDLARGGLKRVLEQLEL